MKAEVEHCGMYSGAAFDFGTHKNEFLIRRENTETSECFLVRVPAGRSTPYHQHEDMEQTFVWMTGWGTVISESGVFRVGPGEVVFVPRNTLHAVVAGELEEVVYLCVNAFASEPDGASSVGHAELVAGREAAEFARSPVGPLDIIDASEVEMLVLPTTEFGHQRSSCTTRYFASPDAALTSRMLNLGPFKIAIGADRSEKYRIGLDELVNFIPKDLPQGCRWVLSGSQSPLSVKPPAVDSDIDMLLVLSKEADLGVANLWATQAGQELQLRTRVSVGLVLEQWLALPGFYECVDFGIDVDRHWWTATEDERSAESERRVRLAREALTPSTIGEILSATASVVGLNVSLISRAWLSPRWWSLCPRPAE